MLLTEHLLCTRSLARGARSPRDQVRWMLAPLCSFAAEREGLREVSGLTRATQPESVVQSSSSPRAPGVGIPSVPGAGSLSPCPVLWAVPRPSAVPVLLRPDLKSGVSLEESGLQRQGAGAHRALPSSRHQAEGRRAVCGDPERMAGGPSGPPGLHAGAPGAFWRRGSCA